jgi:hypothetical protein
MLAQRHRHDVLENCLRELEEDEGIDAIGRGGAPGYATAFAIPGLFTGAMGPRIEISILPTCIAVPAELRCHEPARFPRTQ